MERIVLQHACILTLDGSDRFFPDGSIVIEDGAIVQIGSSEDISVHASEGLDFSGKIVMPGLVNTHIHTHSPLFRNMGEDVELHTWLEEIMWPAESYLTAERAYWGSKLACLESIVGGVTTFADQFYYAQTTAEAVEPSGLRAFVCSTIFEHGDSAKGQTLQTAADFLERWESRSNLITPALGPHAPYSVSAGQWKEVVDLSARSGAIVHTHISETKKENEGISQKYGKSPSRWLADLGVLDRHVLAAHCVHLSDDDIEILKEHDVHVSYNPVSNLKLVSGIMPYQKLKSAGVQLSIGTDGAQSNNTLDLLQDLKIGVLIQKQAAHDPKIFDVREAVRLATIEGAKALGMAGHIGSLEIGKQADLIAIDLRAPHVSPLVKESARDLYTTLVYCATGRDVTDTMVSGTWLMRDRNVLSMNPVEIMKECEKVRKDILRYIHKE